jgi:hypothetical protein
MQYFVPPVEGSQQTTHSLRASQYEALQKKRKRRAQEEDDDEEPQISPEPHSGAPSNAHSPTASFVPLTAAETAQLRVAGLLPDEALKTPRKPFPHAPVHARTVPTPGRVQRELAALKPPLYAPAAAKASQRVDGLTQKDTLRQTHLGNLTALLHRCLLEGDYDRAAQAWGLLLRSRGASKPIDVRAHGRWAIGAEIHLQRHRISKQSQIDKHVDDDGDASMQPQTDDQPSASIEDDLFSEEGFRSARRYYDMLILQYPYRKRFAHKVHQGHFYPAMFSLWIYQVSQRSKIANERLQETFRRSESASRMSTSDDSDHRRGELPQNTSRNNVLMSDEERQILDSELASAREIADRLDQLLGAPPYDKRADLLQLRGMVGLWIGDLLPHDASGPDPMDEDGDEANYSSRLEARQQTADRQSQVDDAQYFLRRAAENGAVLWDGNKRLGSEGDR